MFSVTSDKLHGILMLRCRGKISIGGGDTFLREAVAKAVKAQERGIVLDFAAVTTIDSSGFGELVGVQATCLARHIMLVAAAVPDKLIELFYVTKLSMVIPVFSTAEAAVEAMAPLSFEDFLKQSNAWTLDARSRSDSRGSS